MKRKMYMLLSALLAMCILSACRQDTKQSESAVDADNDVAAQESVAETKNPKEEEKTSNISNVAIQFGNGGTTYTIVMEDNETAIELVRNVTDAGRNLPIYNYDNFEGYEYYQYYDIPTRYEIPSNPVSITSAKAGEVYYSDPNRLMLFYQDAEISGEYTKVGQIKDTTGLKEAVESNPVLEGWGNKLILLRYAE